METLMGALIIEAAPRATPNYVIAHPGDKIHRRTFQSFGLRHTIKGL